MLRMIARGVGVVALGSATGQAVVLFITPWLARNHTPEEFGALALLMTVSNIATAVACGRYDLALPAATDDDVSPLFRLAFIVAILSAIVALFVLLVAQVIWGDWRSPFDNPWLIFLCIFFVGVQQAVIGISTRDRHYAAIGTLRLAQGGVFAVTALIPGFGLVLAHVVSFAVSLPGALRRLAGSNIWSDIGRIARERSDFPMLSLPGAILDVVGYSMCVWIIVYFYGSQEAGHYSQIQRVVGAPLMLLGISIGQVLMRSGVDVSNDRVAMLELLRRICMLIALFGIAILLALSFAGEPILHLLLGEQWRVENSFVLPIAVAVTARACVSPISTILITLRRFDLSLRWQLIYFFSSTIVFSFSAMHLDLNRFVFVYALHEFLLYCLYLQFIAKAIRILPCAASSV